MTVPPSTPPPTGPWYRRYWGYYNRPYAGCGCLYTILLVLLPWWLLALLFPALAVWDTIALAITVV